MEKNTRKVREKSGNFVSPEKWEPCLFAVKILARNVVNQSKRDVICVTQIKQVLGVSLIEAKSVILQMPLRVLTDVKNIYICLLLKIVGLKRENL